MQKFPLLSLNVLTGCLKGLRHGGKQEARGDLAGMYFRHTCLEQRRLSFLDKEL